MQWRLIKAEPGEPMTAPDAVYDEQVAKSFLTAKLDDLLVVLNFYQSILV